MLSRLTLLSGRYRLWQGCTCSSRRPSLLISVSLTWPLDHLISCLAQSSVALGLRHSGLRLCLPHFRTLLPEHMPSHTFYGRL